MYHGERGIEAENDESIGSRCVAIDTTELLLTCEIGRFRGVRHRPKVVDLGFGGCSRSERRGRMELSGYFSGAAPLQIQNFGRVRIG